MRAGGLTMDLHPETKKKDMRLRYGVLRGSIDGIRGTYCDLFFEPYDDQLNN